MTKPAPSPSRGWVQAIGNLPALCPGWFVCCFAVGGWCYSGEAKMRPVGDVALSEGGMGGSGSSGSAGVL